MITKSETVDIEQDDLNDLFFFSLLHALQNGSQYSRFSVSDLIVKYTTKLNKSAKEDLLEALYEFKESNEFYDHSVWDTIEAMLCVTQQLRV